MPLTVRSATELPDMFTDLRDLLRRCPHSRTNHWLGNLFRRAAGVSLNGKTFVKTDDRTPKWSTL